VSGANILAPPTSGTPTAFTITLAGLAAAAGRQSTMVTNSGNFRRAIGYVIIETGTAPTAGGTYDVYLLRGDGTGTYRTDGAGASDAAITIVNATFLASAKVTASANTNFYVDFDTADVTNDLGPEWGIAVVNNTSQAAHAATATSLAEFLYIVDQIQLVSA